VKRLICIFALCLGLVIQTFGATAQDLQPVGKLIGQDKQSNPIYRVHANGIDIAYKLIGAGEPLVLIPGMGNLMDRWPESVVAQLSKKYQLIILDNRGMGLTTANDTVFTYKLFADDVIGLLDALGVKKANVLGFSMGSVITQELLLEYPQRVLKAVLYGTSIDGSDVVQAVKGKAFTDPIILRQVEATSHWKPSLEKERAIANQVMLIIGTADTVVGIADSKKLASIIPGVWLIQFKNATHHLMDEATAEFTRIVLTFLEINETVGAPAPQ
jgi:pimeloyl-ACP methyl ester carboxylesterase